MRSVALMIVAAVAASATQAGEVFRWVDENGKVHYGDSVPDRFKAKARPVEDRTTAPTPEQRDETNERLAREKERAEAAARTREAAAKKASSTATPTPAAPSAKPSPRMAAGDCEEQWRRYQESLECFAPYRNFGGIGIKPEAFNKCPDVKQPVGCRQPPDSSSPTYVPPTGSRTY